MKKTARALLFLALLSWTALRSEEFQQVPVVEPSQVRSSAADAPPERREVFNLLPGFQVERLYDVPHATQGSWVCLTVDQKGRLIASDQGGNGLYRIVPPPIGSDAPTRVEKLKVNVTAAQGMLAAFDSLYVLVNGGPSAVVRLRDTTGDDNYDEVVRLREIQGANEHGPHGLCLSPDGEWIYLICGNDTRVPEKESSRVPRNWDEDRLLPYHPDPFGFCQNHPPTGGFVCRFDRDAKNWELVSSGLRNPYDLDFSPAGELFTFDADMEDDMGTAWYRPTRVCHVVSGSDYGWRNGSGKWHPEYADTLPPVVDIGPGCPVGVTFGTGANFPQKFQEALFILDWSFGTVYAVHLEPSGASWTGKAEEFLSRAPLPLTDAVVGHDGALYFTIGGRNLESALFRATWVGKDEAIAASASVTNDDSGGTFAEMRDHRRRLATFHHRFDDPSKVISAVVPHLGHSDRFIRHAARIALEFQDPMSWGKTVLGLNDPQAVITGVVALARQGDKSLHATLLRKLGELEFRSLSHAEQLELLRAYALVCIRMGRPNEKETKAIIAHLDEHFPARTAEVNRELSRVLAYLESPTAVQKTIALMQRAETRASQNIPDVLRRNEFLGNKIADMIATGQDPLNMHYARVLSNVRQGWTPALRGAYFDWTLEALTGGGGKSYLGYVENIRRRALENCSEEERAAVVAATPPAPKLPSPIGPGREWTVSDVMERAKDGMTGRSFENGRRTFSAAQCIVCHRLGRTGGGTGPNLTNLGTRFSLHDMVDTIVDPSRTIPGRYLATVLVTSSGEAFTGREIATSDGLVTLMTDPVDPTKRIHVKQADIVERSESPISMMPSGLLNTLNEREVLDLLAYLVSQGNPGDPVFSK